MKIRFRMSSEVVRNFEGLLFIRVIALCPIYS